MISLFASAQKDNSIDFEEEANRARIQAVIDRVIEVPEVAIADEMQAFFAGKEASESVKPAGVMDPWDALKDFVREEVTENAA